MNAIYDLDFLVNSLCAGEGKEPLVIRTIQVKNLFTFVKITSPRNALLFVNTKFREFQEVFIY